MYLAKAKCLNSLSKKNQQRGFLNKKSILYHDEFINLFIIMHIS